MGVDNLECLEYFKRLGADACTRGWHEANGGNLSYRLRADEVAQCIQDFSSANKWHALTRAVPALASAYILITASGAYMSKLEYDAGTLGIIELDDKGSAWRSVWGFANGATPSSELETHLAAYEKAIEAGDEADRVIYHAHCPQIIALSALFEPSACTWTRALWQIMTEMIIVFPQGIGVVPWMVPGSPELAQATVELMGTYKLCVWTNHGAMTRAASFDEAFGQIETVEKAAGIYLQARAANGGAEPGHLVSDEELRAICRRYGIVANEAFLD